MCCGSRCPVPGACLVRTDTVEDDISVLGAQIITTDHCLGLDTPQPIIVLDCSGALCVRNDALQVFYLHRDHIVLVNPHAAFEKKLALTGLLQFMNVCHHPDPPCFNGSACPS